MGSFESLEAKYLTYAHHGNLDELKKCLEKGVDVNARDDEGNNASLFACRNGDIPMLELLISRGVSLERNNLGWSPLLFAAEFGHFSMVVYLLELDKGLNMNIIHDKNNFGSTPLLCAAEHGHLEMVDFLLSMGSRIGDVDIFGRKAVTWAAENKHILVVNRICAWPVTMAIIFLLELQVFYQLDFSSIIEIYELTFEFANDTRDT